MPLSADEYHAWFIANDTKNSRQVWKIICLATIPLPYSKVRADLFSGSLAVWSVRGGAAHFARQTHPSRAPRGEGRIPFELSLKYTAQ